MSRVLRRRSPQRTDVVELEEDKILMLVPGEPVEVRVELYIHISASPPVPEPLRCCVHTFAERERYLLRMSFVVMDLNSVNSRFRAIVQSDLVRAPIAIELAFYYPFDFFLGFLAIFPTRKSGDGVFQDDDDVGVDVVILERAETICKSECVPPL